MKRLASAIEVLRANLGTVLADLEAGNRAAALSSLAKAERQFRSALKGLRS